MVGGPRLAHISVGSRMVSSRRTFVLFVFARVPHDDTTGMCCSVCLLSSGLISIAGTDGLRVAVPMSVVLADHGLAQTRVVPASSAYVCHAGPRKNPTDQLAKPVVLSDNHSGPYFGGDPRQSLG